LNLYFLVGNGVEFAGLSDDPWYRATVQDGLYGDTSVDDSAASYRPEEAASPLACVDHRQFCNPSLPPGEQCGPLAGGFDSLNGAASLFDTSIEELSSNITGHNALSSRFFWWVSMATSSTPVDVVTLLGSLSITSVQSLRSG
jgi:hypothetical protein